MSLLMRSQSLVTSVLSSDVTVVVLQAERLGVAGLVLHQKDNPHSFSDELNLNQLELHPRTSFKTGY